MGMCDQAPIETAPNREMCRGQVVVVQIIITTHQDLMRAEVEAVEAICLVHRPE